MPKGMAIPVRGRHGQNFIFGIGSSKADDATSNQTSTFNKRPGQIPAANQAYQARATYTITGITREGNGNALGNFYVYLYQKDTMAFVAQTISDGSGNYSFTVPNNSTEYFVVIHREDVVSLAGVTLRNLRGT